MQDLELMCLLEGHFAIYFLSMHASSKSGSSEEGWNLPRHGGALRLAVYSVSKSSRLAKGRFKVNGL